MEFESLFKVIDRLSKYVVMNFEEDEDEEIGIEDSYARSMAYRSRYAEVDIW